MFMNTLIAALVMHFMVGSMSSARATQQPADVAFDKLAHQLELVRNQIELTISNHRALSGDIKRQQREFEGMNVFTRIPEAKHDKKSDRELLASLRNEFERVAEKRTGFKLRTIKFMGPWKSAPKKIPAELPFDVDYRMPEGQIVDSRFVHFELDFSSSAPLNPSDWLLHQQDLIGRMFTPIKWSRRGKRVLGDACIYRFREFTYPRMTAPDLSRYVSPRQPASEAQRSAHQRIERYRREIMQLWPKCEPYLGDFREFARNDLRMNFFLKRVNVRPNR